MKWKKKANLQKTTGEETQSLYEAIIFFLVEKHVFFMPRGFINVFKHTRHK